MVWYSVSHTTVLDPIDRSTERDLIDEISPEELERHVDAFDGLARVSGTEDERTASEYIVETLREYGVEADLLEFEAYISVPEDATVTVTSPTSRRIDDAITTSFGASTPPGGVHGEVVHLTEVSPETVSAENVEGKLVFTSGLPTPEPIRLLEDAGAAGVVFESITEGQLHEMIVTPVWGTPSVDDADEIPDLPVAEIHQSDGEWLRERLAEGPVEITVEAQVTTELTTLPCPVGWVDGTESDRYFVVGNHVDSWYEGLTDNATAMAATLELARVFADREPRRGLVFGFWPAHSTGRYAGSAWYADENWLDLRENAVAYLHIDLNGLKGADSLWYQHMAELGDEHLDAMETATEFDIREGDESWLGSSDRPARNSDQSFWGVGASSLLSGARLTPGTEEGGPIGGGWWWHTPEDTRDKVDVDVLAEETKLYVALAARLCESPVLPHDFSATVDDFRSELTEIEDTAPEEIEFAGVRDRLDRLEEAVAAANAVINERADDDPDLARAAEDLQVALGNQLTPALYMERRDYEHEPALPYDRLPGLRIAEAASDSEGRQRLFTETKLRRERTRVAHRIEAAADATERFLARWGEKD